MEAEMCSLWERSVFFSLSLLLSFRFGHSFRLEVVHRYHLDLSNIYTSVYDLCSCPCPCTVAVIYASSGRLGQHLETPWFGPSLQGLQKFIIGLNFQPTGCDCNSMLVFTEVWCQILSYDTLYYALWISSNVLSMTNINLFIIMLTYYGVLLGC
jgi:hypothetical protein